MSDDDVLEPDLLLNAYVNGIFPMADEDGTIYWYAPDPRAVIDLEGFRVSRSLRKTWERGVFEIRINHDFLGVLRSCADREEGTWISETIIEAYNKLHHMGFAHSVESWKDGKLAGGLYGVSINGAFFGESMFFRETDASKIALLALVRRMRDRGLTLLDTQFTTNHLEQFGIIELSRIDYLARLDDALNLACSFVDTPGTMGQVS